MRLQRTPRQQKRFHWLRIMARRAAFLRTGMRRHAALRRPSRHIAHDARKPYTPGAG